MSTFERIGTLTVYENETGTCDTEIFLYHSHFKEPSRIINIPNNCTITHAKLPVWVEKDGKGRVTSIWLWEMTASVIDGYPVEWFVDNHILDSTRMDLESYVLKYINHLYSDIRDPKSNRNLYLTRKMMGHLHMNIYQGKDPIILTLSTNDDGVEITDYQRSSTRLETNGYEQYNNLRMDFIVSDSVEIRTHRLMENRKKFLMELGLRENDEIYIGADEMVTFGHQIEIIYAD